MPTQENPVLKALQSIVPELFLQLEKSIPGLQGLGIDAQGDPADASATNYELVIQVDQQAKDALADSAPHGNFLQSELGDADLSKLHATVQPTAVARSPLRVKVEKMPPFTATETYAPITDDLPVPQMFSHCTHERPARGGSCIAPKDSAYGGTLGGIVTDPQGKHHILSNAHVLAGADNHFGSGHPIQQPCDGPEIAHLTRAVDLTADDVLGSDSALAEVISNDDVTRAIRDIGTPVGIAAPVQHSRVRLSGMSSDHIICGNIIHTGMTIKVRSNSGSYLVRDVFQLDVPAHGGDSGSLALDDDLNIIGLACASNRLYVSCCDIRNVIQDLNLQGWLWS